MVWTPQGILDQALVNEIVAFLEGDGHQRFTERRLGRLA